MKATTAASGQKTKLFLDAKLATVDSLYKGNGQARLEEEYGVGK